MIAALLKPLVPSIYRWALYAAVAAAVLAAVAGKAYLAGDDHGQGVVRTADAKDQAAVYARFEANVKRGDLLAAELELSNHQAQTYYDKLKKEAADETHPIVAAPGAATALPSFTARALCVWNRAWAGYDVPGVHAGAGDDHGPDCAAADDESPTAFDIRDALFSSVAEADACWQDIRDYRQLRADELARAQQAGKH